MPGPLDITVSTAVVVTALITLHVTNRLDIATKDVTQDILIKAATKVSKDQSFLHLLQINYKFSV